MSNQIGWAADMSLQDELAPLNPEFQNHLVEKESMLMFESRETAGQTFGRVPSPLDWSHLKSQSVSLMFRTTTPTAFDLRDEGFVTAVRNQGSCGACWTFSTYGALESTLLMLEGKPWDFSENHLKNHHGFDMSPCEGGNEQMSIAYLTRWAGPVSESDDPYNDRADRLSPGGPCQKYVTTVLRYSSSEEIKNAIVNSGAVHAWMFYDDRYFNSSMNTYFYDGRLSGADEVNHDITIVGWHDKKSVEGAQTNGAWIAKNSWGRLFGENGYFYISYEDAKAVTEAVGYYDAVPTSSYQHIYQYDPLGQTTSWGGQETAWGANVFTAEANEVLSAVGFYTLAQNTSYEVCIYDRFNGSFFSELLVSTEGTLTFPGYYTVTLPTPVTLMKGDDFGIVVKLTTPGYSWPVPLEMPIDGYNTVSTANAGESYVSKNGVTFTDITDEYPNTNVCIKGLTVDPDSALPNVLICGAEKEVILDDIRQKLLATGQFNDVNVMNINAATPTLADLQAFDAVLVYQNIPYNDPSTFGDVMADYVDAGGGVVCTMFEIASGYTMMKGRWDSEQYYAIPRSEIESGSRATLGTVHDPEHPIMQGVSVFDGGFSSYRPSSLDVMPDAVRIADWSDGRPLVVTKMMGDVRRVDLGFYPVSSDINNYSWDATTDGALLIANALIWVANQTDKITLP
ncbi:MAG: hypothetical protein JXM79_04735 [Sedimentisphaerales bacterium]|nr:hypothetical protein [Sedimentisphaerales bacterium]